MDLLLKQRLVGAAVIISLGVVIIPMLLDGSGNRIIQEIPPRPERQGTTDTGSVKEQVIPSPPKSDEGEVVYSSEPMSIKPEPEAESPVRQADAPKQSVSSNIKDVTAKTAEQNTSDKDSVASKVQASKPQVANIAKMSKSTSNSQPPTVQESSPQVVQGISTQKLASWVVQVGSFTEKSKAINLRDQLKSKGFTVFMEHFKNSEQNSMYRVRVGPVQLRSEAEAVLIQVKQQIKLENGYVTQHP